MWIAIALLVGALLATGWLLWRSHVRGAHAESELRETRSELSAIQARFSTVLDIEAERQRVTEDLTRQRQEAEAKAQRLRNEVQVERASSERQIATAREKLEQDAASRRVHAEAEARQLQEAVETDRRQVEQQTSVMRSELERDIATRQAQAEDVVRAMEAQAERSVAALRVQQSELATQIESLTSQVSALKAEVAPLDEQATLQSFGYYRPQFPFATSTEYEVRLAKVCDDQRSMIKDKVAAVCPVEWTVDGDRVKGRKKTNQMLRLMIRAFNGEADAAIAKVRYNNIRVMESRIRKAYEVINGLAEVQQCSIVPRYLELKLEELFLAHELHEKLYQEREEQRRIRARMRDEEIAERQLEKARREAEEDEIKYEDALVKARTDVEQANGRKHERLVSQIAELERRLEEAHANKERAIARAQLTRSGHVYVISNLGSFGEHIYKIGMTRRLDPHERIRELGDASVPFEFDVHAVIFSEDAPR
jgi:hypothetical protein